MTCREQRGAAHCGLYNEEAESIPVPPTCSKCWLLWVALLGRLGESSKLLGLKLEQLQVDGQMVRKWNEE